MRDKETARRRLAFDELLRVQMVLVLRKRALEREARGLAHAVGGELVRRFHEALPYPLTGAQRQAISEIEADLAAPHPMHRLLQGDVGAGKTVVAVSTLLAAVQGGHQGALMAPTEVLAEQHATGVRALLGDLRVPDPANLFGERPLRVELLTNRVTGNDRKEVLAGLADGSVDIAIGTHALIQEGVAFSSLGAVVVDEQHRFGVEQRAAATRQVEWSRARPARDDRHADPAHRGDDRVRRPRRERARRAAARPHADRHEVGERPADGGRGVGRRARRGGRGAAGLRGVPAHRREREARGGVGRGDLPAAVGR